MTDGPWDKQDDAMVAAAIQDASAAVTAAAVDKKGGRAFTQMQEDRCTHNLPSCTAHAESTAG